MSKEYRSISLGFTVLDCEDLPAKNGVPMYADDVAEEISEVVKAAVWKWHQERGHLLLACEPV